MSVPPDITLIPKICSVLDINEHELIQSSNDLGNKREDDDSKKIKNITLYFSSICYLVAIFVCFIVNLANNHAFAWFCIVLTLCLTIFTLIPTGRNFFQKKYIVLFTVSTCISLVLLSIICLLYTVYELYVDRHLFLLASIGTLFGYFSLFYPIIFFKIKKIVMEKRKIFMLSYFIGLLLLSLLLLLVVTMYSEIDFLWGSILITIIFYGLLYSYSIVEFLNINRLSKLGISGVIICIECFEIEYVILKVVGEELLSKYKVDFSDWINHTSGNLQCIIILSIFFISIVFLVVGYIKGKK